VSKRLQAGDALDIRVQGNAFGLWLDDQLVGESPAFTDAGATEAAIARLRAALAPEEA
jgi:tryptophanyl-tRNA synthetase